MKKKGNPNFERDRNRDTRAANQTRIKNADEFARKINALFTKLNKEGIKTNKGLAEALNANNIKTSRQDNKSIEGTMGTKGWSATQVKRIKERVKGLKDHGALERLFKQNR